MLVKVLVTDFGRAHRKVSGVGVSVSPTACEGSGLHPHFTDKGPKAPRSTQSLLSCLHLTLLKEGETLCSVARDRGLECQSCRVDAIHAGCQPAS